MEGGLRDEKDGMERWREEWRDGGRNGEMEGGKGGKGGKGARVQGVTREVPDADGLIEGS